MSRQTSHETVRVFILADVRLYREGLARALAPYQGLEVVGMAPIDPHSLGSVAAASPDVVLVEATVINRKNVQSILGNAPCAGVVAFGVIEDDVEVIRCVEAGIAGYVPRDGTVDDLATTVESVARGEFRCSARVAALLVKRVSALSEAGHRSVDNETLLTVRERQVIALIEDGLSNKEIARCLAIEVSTVKNHVHSILAKSNSRRRGEAAARMRSAFHPSPSRPA